MELVVPADLDEADGGGGVRKTLRDGQHVELAGGTYGRDRQRRGGQEVMVCGGREGDVNRRTAGGGTFRSKARHKNYLQVIQRMVIDK